MHLACAPFQLVLSVVRVVARRNLRSLLARYNRLATAVAVLVAHATEHGSALGEEGPEGWQAGADDSGADVDV